MGRNRTARYDYPKKGWSLTEISQREFGKGYAHTSDVEGRRCKQIFREHEAKKIKNTLYIKKVKGHTGLGYYISDDENYVGSLNSKFIGSSKSDVNDFLKRHHKKDVVKLMFKDKEVKMVEYKGVKVRELKDDNDVVQLLGFAIRWSKKNQRFTIRDVRKRRQVYDTKYFDGAVRWVIDNSAYKGKANRSVLEKILPVPRGYRLVSVKNNKMTMIKR